MYLKYLDEVGAINLLLYVDDMLLARKSKAEISKLKKLLCVMSLK